MPAPKLNAFVERLRRWNEGLVNMCFCYWALKYLEGNLDSPPQLVDSSSDEWEWQWQVEDDNLPVWPPYKCMADYARLRPCFVVIHEAKVLLVR